MFEDIIRKATNTAGKVIKQEVAKGAANHISLGVKIVTIAVMAVLAIKSTEKIEKPEETHEVEVPSQIIHYNFYGDDGKKALELCKF